MNNDISDDILAQMGITLPTQEDPRDEKEIFDTLRSMPSLKGLSENDFKGEMCIIDGSPRSASIKALEDSVCLAMDASYTDNLKGQAKIYFQCILYHIFSQVLVDRLRKMNEDLVKTRDENVSLKEEIRQMKSRG